MRKAASMLILALVCGLAPFAVVARAQDRDDAPKATKATAKDKDKDKDKDRERRAAARIVKGPVIEWVGPTDAVISWTTNVPSSTVVRYGTAANALGQKAEKPWGGTNHRVKITGLRPDTTYFFQVESEHAQGTGTQAESNPLSFRTPNKGAKGEHYPKPGF